MIRYLPQHRLLPNAVKIKTVFRLLNVDWQEFVTMFEAFSILRNNKINTLSGGERRVIETYLVLKSPGKIILMDEPFSHIAPLYIERFKQMIELKKQIKAIIITDHYYLDVLDTADNLYLLKNGCTKRIDNIKDLEDYKYLNSGRLD